MAELQQRFGVVFRQDEQFFSEWFTNLPDLSAEETATLEQMQVRFDRHQNRAFWAEGTVNC